MFCEKSGYIKMQKKISYFYQALVISIPLYNGENGHIFP